jgi:hypothetical protein
MLEWYNLIFNLAFVALLMYGFVAMTGIIGDTGDVHVGDHDIGGHDVGGHDVGGHDVGGHDVHGGHHEGAHHEGSHEHGGLWGVRGFFGRNKAPMSMVIMIALVLWGGSGLTTNVILGERLHQNAWWVVVSILVAATVSTLGTAGLSRVIGNVMPVSESYASSPRELVGQTAQVRFDVSQEAGTIQLRDKHGNLLDLQGRAPSGGGPFRSGTAVRIVSHLHSNVYLVGPAT